MNHARFEHAVVTVAIGDGAQRVALSLYSLSDGLKHCWVDRGPALETFLWRLELSFRYTGGVPDSLEVRASRPFLQSGSHDWSQSFKRFCAHFGVELIRAEGAISCTRRAVADWLQTRSYDNLEHCEQTLRDAWPSREGSDPLRPLPATPFISSKASFRRVAGDGFLTHRGDAYSVPDEYRGKSVWAQTQGSEVMVCTKEGRLLARHPSGAGNGDVFLQKPHFARRQPVLSAALRWGFLGSFPQSHAFLAGLIAQRGNEASSAARSILELATHHGAAALGHALDLALEYNNFSLRFIKGCLPTTRTTTTTSSPCEQATLF